MLSIHSSLRTLAAALTVTVALSTATFAVEPDERLADPALETRARNISSELRCLVCQNQSIDDSNAPLARDLRLLVRERLTAGNSDADIMRFLVERYGEFVLLRPRLTPKTVVLWFMPFLLLAIVVYTLWIRNRRGASVIADTDRPLTSEEQRKLEKILSGDNDR